MFHITDQGVCREQRCIVRPMGPCLWKQRKVGSVFHLEEPLLKVQMIDAKLGVFFLIEESGRDFWLIVESFILVFWKVFWTNQVFGWHLAYKKTCAIRFK